MSLKSKNQISTNEYELEVCISPDIFNKEVDKVYRRDIKKINVPGFRKGKAPRAFVEKYYGEEIFYEDAVKNLYPKAMEEATKEANLDLVEVTKIDILTSNKNDGLTFKTTVVVEPEVEIGDYTKLEVEKLSSEVTQEDIDKELQDIRVRNGRLVNVDSRPAQMGDTVLIDFKGSIDGQDFGGGASKNFSLELGKNQFIPGFEEQVVGHKENEDFEINVTFPENYHAKGFAGKNAVFRIHLHEIKERELPDLDDEFIKDISEFDTVDEFKEDLKKVLAERKEEENKEKRFEQVGKQIINLIKADIPEAMVKHKTDELIEDFANQLKKQGADIETYTELMGLSKEDLQKQFRPSAEIEVKLNLAVKKIAENEKIFPNDVEIDAEYKKFADEYKLPVEKVKIIVPKELIERDLKKRKVMELVNSRVVEI